MHRRWLLFASRRVYWPDEVEHELQVISGAVAQGITNYLASVNQALRKGDHQTATMYAEEIRRLLATTGAVSALRPQIQTVTAQPEPTPAKFTAEVDTYWISSATLAEAHAFLTQHLPGTHQEPEWMLAVTGLKQDRIRTLEHLIEVRLASQSGGQASFDMQDFTRIAVSLHEHGQALHAIFHSHRFTGPPHPSGTDDRLQRIIEEGGYPAIQAVFSEDGYVRFFARQRRFAVEVHGKGVKSIERELFRIVQFSALPHPAAATQMAR